MNIFEEAFKNANVKPTDFEDRQIDEDKIKADMQIEFLEKWLKMLERNASEKEKYNFVTDHGFVTVMQLQLYMECIDDVQNLEYELEESRYDISDEEISRRKEEIEQKKILAENIKNIHYYKMVLRKLGQKDITPYGVDILKQKF